MPTIFYEMMIKFIFEFLYLYVPVAITYHNYYRREQLNMSDVKLLCSCLNCMCLHKFVDFHNTSQSCGKFLILFSSHSRQYFL